MNFEDLITRTIDGLEIIADKVSNPEVGSHSSMMFVVVDKDTFEIYSDSQIEDLEAIDWRWHKDFGFVLPTVG